MTSQVKVQQPQIPQRNLSRHLCERRSKSNLAHCDQHLVTAAQLHQDQEAYAAPRNNYTNTPWFIPNYRILTILSKNKRKQDIIQTDKLNKPIYAPEKAHPPTNPIWYLYALSKTEVQLPCDKWYQITHLISSPYRPINLKIHNHSPEKHPHKTPWYKKINAPDLFPVCLLYRGTYMHTKILLHVHRKPRPKRNGARSRYREQEHSYNTTTQLANFNRYWNRIDKLKWAWSWM